ncbi:MAG: putative secreted protein, partial [Verrucomicrobiales bacterium]|nr:putative secreted protein [Verrucomicrobiales bacterium]
MSAALLMCAVCALKAEAAERLGSPDKRIQVTIEMPAPGSTDRPRWSATFRGSQVLTNCQLGLEIADGGELMAGSRLTKQTRRSNDKTIPVLFGKSDHARDRFNELSFTFQNREKRRVEVNFHCYDDAIALRYVLPAGPQTQPVTVKDETTSFGLDGDPVAYVQYLENYQTSHEHNVTQVRYGDLKSGALLDMP